MALSEERKNCSISAIDGQDALLRKVSEKIWNNPELAFGEFKAHDLLVKTFSSLGFKVTAKYVLPTAFKAEFGCGTDGPAVGLICEYDALPNIGHACGHNLISTCGMGAAIGIKAAMEAKGINGTLIVFGTPAEERGGGKTYLIDGGAFKSIDFCMMAHGGPANQCFSDLLAMQFLTVTYKGKASHASASPWDGINALDAVVTAYNNISLLRQQMKPIWRIHGIISKGGTAPNVIPAETEMMYMLRTKSMADAKILRNKVEDCFRSAATATGCEVSISENSKRYDSVLNNVKMMELYKKYAMEIGQVVQKDGPEHEVLVGSTDMGNVSQVVPSIHPLFAIGTSSSLHTTEFASAAITEEAHKHTIVISKALALTALEVMTNPIVLNEIKEEFRNHSE